MDYFDAFMIPFRLIVTGDFYRGAALVAVAYWYITVVQFRKEDKKINE